MSSFAKALNKDGHTLDNWLLSQELAGSEVVLDAGSDDAVHVALTTSLETAAAEFTRLHWQIALIAIVALVIAMLLAAIIARGVSRPLQQLSGAARKLQQGDYSESELSLNDDEFGELANTLAACARLFPNVKKEFLIRHLMTI